MKSIFDLLVIAFLVVMFIFAVVIIHQDRTITQQKSLIRLLWTDTQRAQAACQ